MESTQNITQQRPPINQQYIKKVMEDALYISMHRSPNKKQACEKSKLMRSFGYVSASDRKKAIKNKKDFLIDFGAKHNLISKVMSSTLIKMQRDEETLAKSQRKNASKTHSNEVSISDLRPANEAKKIYIYIDGNRPVQAHRSKCILYTHNLDSSVFPSKEEQYRHSILDQIRILERKAKQKLFKI